MRKYQIDFQRVPVGQTFCKNGNEWFKRSTRTAHIINPVEYRGVWFYFGNLENCTVYLQTEFKSSGVYGMYKVTMEDGFSAITNAASERGAIDSLFSANIIAAPDSAIYSCKLIETIEGL